MLYSKQLGTGGELCTPRAKIACNTTVIIISITINRQDTGLNNRSEYSFRFREVRLES